MPANLSDVSVCMWVKSVGSHTAVLILNYVTGTQYKGTVGPMKISAYLFNLLRRAGEFTRLRKPQPQIMFFKQFLIHEVLNCIVILR